MKKQVHGEGNYKATRDYNERTKEYLESADVEKEARAAAPRDEREAREMRKAEQQGKQHAKLKEHERNSQPLASDDAERSPGRRRPGGPCVRRAVVRGACGAKPKFSWRRPR